MIGESGSRLRTGRSKSTERLIFTRIVPYRIRYQSSFALIHLHYHTGVGTRPRKAQSSYQRHQYWFLPAWSATRSPCPGSQFRKPETLHGSRLTTYNMVRICGHPHERNLTYGSLCHQDRQKLYQTHRRVTFLATDGRFNVQQTEVEILRLFLQKCAILALPFARQETLGMTP